MIDSTSIRGMPRGNFSNGSPSLTEAARIATQNNAKRFFDLLVCVIGVLVIAPILLPLFLIISGAILIRSGRPIFFGHTRMGLNGKSFQCFKFRTMVRDSGERLEAYLHDNPEAREEWERTFKLANDPRIIPGIGHFLRRTSLDELPQLFNILRGDMSFIGPRPITRKELDLYGDNVGWYLKTRPGLTGAWQVSGRSETSYAERISLDVAYVRDWSLFKDIKILLLTVLVTLNGRGAV